MKKSIYYLFFVLLMSNPLMAQPFIDEFVTELVGESGSFNDVLELNGYYYTLGQGSSGVYYAKYDVNGNEVWAKTITTTASTVVGITKVDDRVFIGYSFESGGTLPVRMVEVDPLTGDEVSSATVLSDNTLNLTHYSQLTTTAAHNHLFLLAGDTMIRYNPDNFNAEFEGPAPVLIQSAVETNGGGILITHGFVNDSATVVRRLNEDTVISSQFRYQFNFGHNRKLVRVGENKYRVFTYDSDTLRTWMVNDTCVDVGNNLFWRIWTSTNPTPDTTYEFEVTATRDSSFILSFKNVILFWSSDNNEGIYLNEIHEHASNHQTIAKTIEDSHGEYVFVGKSTAGHPYISKLGNGVLNEVQTIEGKEPPLLVYPNPTSDFIYIRNVQSNESFQLIDTTGRKVMEGTGRVVDISALKAGVYNLVIGSRSISICKR